MGEIVTTGSSVSLLAKLESVGGVIRDDGLYLPADLSYSDYESIGMMLCFVRDKLQWYIGDWLNYGEDLYENDIYVQAASLTQASERTLINWKSVAKRIPPQRRRMGVKYSTHAEVAALDPAAQKRLLAKAEREQLTKEAVRGLVREEKGHPPEPIAKEVCESCGRPL